MLRCACIPAFITPQSLFMRHATTARLTTTHTQTNGHNSSAQLALPNLLCRILVLPRPKKRCLAACVHYRRYPDTARALSPNTPAGSPGTEAPHRVAAVCGLSVSPLTQVIPCINDYRIDGRSSLLHTHPKQGMGRLHSTQTAHMRTLPGLQHVGSGASCLLDALPSSQFKQGKLVVRPCSQPLAPSLHTWGTLQASGLHSTQNIACVQP